MGGTPRGQVSLLETTALHCCPLHHVNFLVYTSLIIICFQNFPTLLHLLMLSSSPLFVNDASPQRSIWQDVGERNFRQNVATLQQVSTGTPADPKIYSFDDLQVEAMGSTQHDYRLPLVAEQRIADDLAYMIAKKGEAKTVTAAALEQHTLVDTLTIRMSANNGINNHAAVTLRSIFRLLERCAARSISSL